MARPVDPNSRRSLALAKKLLAVTAKKTKTKPPKPTTKTKITPKPKQSPKPKRDKPNKPKGIPSVPKPKRVVKRPETFETTYPWPEVESLFCNGECESDGEDSIRVWRTRAELVAKYGMAQVTFDQRCQAGGWVNKRAAIKAEAKRRSDEALLAEITDDLTTVRVRTFRLAQLGQVKIKNALETGNPKNALVMASAVNTAMQATIRSQDAANSALGIKDAPTAGGLNLNINIGDWTLFSAKNQPVVIDEEIPPTIGEVTR